MEKLELAGRDSNYDFVGYVLPSFIANSLKKPRHCVSQLKQIGLAFHVYQADYDETLMAVDDWTRNAKYYVKEDVVFQCPQQNDNGYFTPQQSGYTDYFFNSHLSGLSLTKLENESATLVLLGEGNDGVDIANAHYNRRDFAASWLANTDSPLHRHNGTSNVLFLDGHVKAYKPAEVMALQFMPKMLNPR